MPKSSPLEALWNTKGIPLEYLGNPSGIPLEYLGNPSGIPEKALLESLCRVPNIAVIRRIVHNAVDFCMLKLTHFRVTAVALVHGTQPDLYAWQELYDGLV